LSGLFRQTGDFIRIGGLGHGLLRGLRLFPVIGVFLRVAHQPELDLFDAVCERADQPLH
jgi:hypothetical protein